MRINSLGDAHCQTADEARQMIEKCGVPVCATGIYAAIDGFPASGEIREAASGRLVCYLEAATHSDVENIIAELNISTR